MAQQSTRKQSENVPSLPRSPRLPQGKTGAWDYARWRLTINDPDQFMDFMRGYPAREGITIFLYRLVPKIDLSLIGQRESNIQKGGYQDLQAFSLEAVAEKFGRGKYNLKVTDSNRAEGQREVIKGCQYKIVDAEKPPVYDIRTLELGHSDNIDEVNRLITSGVLIRDANGVPRLRTAADAGAPAAPAVIVAPAAPDPLGTSSVVGQIVLAALNKVNQSPGEAVRDTIAIAQLLHPPATPAVDVETVVRRIMSENGRGGAGGDLAAYERVEGFITKVRGVAGVAGAAAPAGTLTDGFAASNPSMWLPHVAPAVREVRGMMTDLFVFLRSNKSAAAPAAEANGAPAASSAGASPAIEGTKPATMRDAIEDVAQRGLQMMHEGVRGFDYAAYICGLYHPPIGLQVFRQLEQFGGVVGLVSMMAMNPLTRAMVNDPAQRAQIETFLSDFFSFEPEPPEDSPEMEAAAAAGVNGSPAAASA